MIGVSVQKAVLEEALIEHGLDMEAAKNRLLSILPYFIKVHGGRGRRRSSRGIERSIPNL